MDLSSGKNVSNLYKAEVVDNEDPEHYFRVKVRIIGVNDSGAGKDDTVWAEVMQGTTPGIDKKIGVSSVIQVGTMVWCMLQDNDPSKPVVVGVLTGKGDVSDALAGDKYINAQSLYTKSGHKVVFDDSEGDETILVYHKTGSFIKIDKEGDIFVTGVRDMQFDIARDVTWNIGQNLTVNVEGNETVNIKGNSDRSVQGNRSETVQGTRSLSVTGDQSSNFSANESISVGSSKSENIGSSLSVSAGSGISNSASSFSVSAPTSTFSGNVSVGGDLSGGGGRSRGGGNAVFTGTLRASNDCIGGGVSLKGHTHGVINHSKTTPPN